MTLDGAACTHKQRLVVAFAGRALACGLESVKAAETVTGAVSGIVPTQLNYEIKHCDDSGLRPTIYL